MKPLEIIPKKFGWKIFLVSKLAQVCSCDDYLLICFFVSGPLFPQASEVSCEEFGFFINACTNYGWMSVCL